MSYDTDEQRKAAHARKAHGKAAKPGQNKVPLSRIKAEKAAPRHPRLRRVVQLPSLRDQLDAGLAIFDSHGNGVALAQRRLGEASLRQLRHEARALARALASHLGSNGWGAIEAQEFASSAVHEAQVADASHVAERVAQAPIRRTLASTPLRGFEDALVFLQSQLDEGEPPSEPFTVQEVEDYSDLDDVTDRAAWRAGVQAARREAENVYKEAGE